MVIVYLDQNKWIDLAKAVKSPDAYPEIYVVLENLVARAKEEKAAFPLTFANVYETGKINNEERRRLLAYVQTTLSSGLVFRGRRRRLQEEIRDVLCDAYGIAAVSRSPLWFLSPIFFESIMEWDDNIGVPISARAKEYILSNPQRFLFEYLTTIPDEDRRRAVRRFTEGSETLRQQLNERRARDRSESHSMRRRIYSALLAIQEVDLILAVANGLGLPAETVADVGPTTLKSIINDCPTFLVEREISLKLESQQRKIAENDFRDMQTFCAALPYADIIVAENLFCSLARQAGLDKKYATHVTTDLLSLPRVLG